MATRWILIFSFCLSFTMFWSCQFTEAVTYRIVKDKSYTTGSPLHEEAGTSRRHCAKLCEAMAACVAADYNRTTSSCQLLENPLSTATLHEGNGILEMGGKLLHILAWNNFPPFLVTIGYLLKCIIHRGSYPGTTRSCLIAPRGWYSEYVNPYIPTQTPEENWSDHMQSPSWQPSLCVAWCLVWWFASLKKLWSYMTPNVLTETRCH